MAKEMNTVAVKLRNAMVTAEMDAEAAHLVRLLLLQCYRVGTLVELKNPAAGGPSVDLFYLSGDRQRLLDVAEDLPVTLTPLEDPGPDGWRLTA